MILLPLKRFRIVALVFLLGASTSARADLVTYTGIGTTGSTHIVNVAATFSSNGTDLTVTLSNNLLGTDPLQVLSGLVFNSSAAAQSTTSLLSAVTGLNSALYTDATHFTNSANVGNNSTNNPLGGKLGWQYESLKTNPLLFVNNQQFQYGLGASGLGGVFGGLGNADYGIVGPKSTIGVTPLSGQLPLVMNTGTGDSSVVFVIHNFTAAASTLNNVVFMFGSAGTDNVTGVKAVPEPSSIALVGTGGLLVAGMLRRRRNAKG